MQNQGYEVRAQRSTPRLSTELYMGFRASNHLSLEVGYLHNDWGSVHLSGTAPPTLGPLLSSVAKDAITVDSALRIGLAYDRQLLPDVCVVPKVGTFYWQGAASAKAGSVTAKASDAGFGLYAGLDLNWRIWRSFAAGSGVDYYLVPGRRDLGTVSLRAQWSFNGF